MVVRNGEPGEPGGPPEGKTGGRGGAGGRGGKGDPTGAGGHGGHGGAGANANGNGNGAAVSLLVVGYFIMAFAVAIAFYGTYYNDQKVEEARVERVRHLNRINEAQCSSLQNLYKVIRKTLSDADMSIDRIAYYIEHPAERIAAHERNQETIERFATPPCPKNVELSNPEE